MRELDRLSPPSPAAAPPPSALTAPERVAIVGNGRLGNALAGALRAAGATVTGPLGRATAPPAEVAAVLRCVPDAETRAAAEAMPAGLPVGHCSGATGLEPLAGSGSDAFSLHPLMTVTGDPASRTFAGAGAAVAGSTPEMLSLARALEQRLGMRPIEIAAGD